MRSFVSVSALRLVAVLAFLVSACEGEVQQDSSPELLAYQASGELDWTTCANQGGFCAFEGTRMVRYGGGSSGNFTAGTFTGGVDCSNKAFGVHFGRGNLCTLQNDATGANTMDMSDGGMDHASGSHVAVTGDFPTGSPGASGPQIMNTDEQPSDSDGTGSFRTRCDFSHMNMDDPIVFPGKPGASHLHAFFGNTGTDAYSTPESILNSGNSTCRGGTLNRSAYWAPALLDAQGRPVAPIEVDVYYKTGYFGVQPNQVQPLPEGLRMIAGDAKSTGAQAHSYWGCRDNYIGKPASITDCGATDAVMMLVIFPQCWDGSSLDSADHKSHLAYPDGSGCPSTHPVALPEVTFKVYYAQPAGGTAGYHLASDMYDTSLPGGYSVHADYFAGWDKDIQKAFVQNCDDQAVDCHSHLLGDGRMLY